MALQYIPPETSSRNNPILPPPLIFLSPHRSHPSYQSCSSRTEENMPQRAADWAARHYPDPKRDVAAKTARIIHEQLAVTPDQYSPASRFIEDLDMTDPWE